MIPKHIFDQIRDKSIEGLALASAPDEDGAAVKLEWCNKAFTKITGYSLEEVSGQKGSILIGPNMSQGRHLLIIEKLMNWEKFSAKVFNNRKNGEEYWHQMTWVPISDPETGHRWWLYSLIELPDEVAHSSTIQAAAPIGQNVAAPYEQKIRRLEQEVTQLQELASAVAKDSHEDTLTELSNRRHFESTLQAWISELGKGGPDFAVLYIDLDRFKSVNDTLGHYAGDRLLISVARKLRKLAADSDLVARIGGDEFIILKPLGESALNISDLADEIVREIQSPFVFEGKLAPTSASIGVAIADSKMIRPEQVIADADTALYHAKSQGRGRWSFFTEEMHTDLILTKQLEADILAACDRREFIAFFQPIIDVTTGQISSAEVLVRWAHPTRGLLSPAAFLDVAANIGMLRRIDGIVFNQLAESMAFFDECGVHVPYLAINTSAERLTDPNLVHDIQSSGLNPSRLVIEILESVSLERMDKVVHEKLNELSEMGVTIAIDDFGTGHASIQGLIQIKPSILKIDRQFITPISSSHVSRTLVSSIVAIGKSLDMKIVAEGVETEKDAQLAADIGCDYLQGFHFGKPVSAEHLRAVLIKTNGRFWSPPSRAANSRSFGL